MKLWALPDGGGPCGGQQQWTTVPQQLRARSGWKIICHLKESCLWRRHQTLPPLTSKSSCKATSQPPTSCDHSQQEQWLSREKNPGWHYRGAGHCTGGTNKTCPQDRLRLQAGLLALGPSQKQHLELQSSDLPGGTFLNALQRNEQSNNSRPKLCE